MLIAFFWVSVEIIFSYFHHEENQYGDCLFMAYVTKIIFLLWFGGDAWSGGKEVC